MPYTELSPSAPLREWVDCIWTRSEDAPANGARVLPDGCADVVFDLSRAEGMVVGTMTKPLLLPPGSSRDFLGVRFRPGRASAFLRLPLADLTDARVALGDVWRTDLASELCEATAERRRTILERELLRRLRPDRDRRVDAAVEILATTPRRIDDVAREIGISRQHLARQFLQHVGVPPKTFARVMRFRRLLDAIDDRPDWADLAARHGFCDQAHLISDFRELAGTTPGSFHFSNP